MNDFALSRWAKQNRPAIKTIITSGLGRAAHAASDLCDDEPYLMKPYDPDGLVREVKRLLARKGK
jgi:two-component SAPR family response regulator